MAFFLLPLIFTHSHCANLLPLIFAQARWSRPETSLREKKFDRQEQLNFVAYLIWSWKFFMFYIKIDHIIQWFRIIFVHVLHNRKECVFQLVGMYYQEVGRQGVDVLSSRMSCNILPSRKRSRLWLRNNTVECFSKDLFQYPRSYDIYNFACNLF